MAGGPTSNPYSGNRHADVLGIEPDDEAGKLTLVEEVKNRAKGAFQQKDMPSAELLYGKAITLLDTIPGKQEATLYSNRAMVRLNLNKVEESLADSNKCLALDPSFVKAHHRKAQALVRLNEWDDAIEAARVGEKLDPTNKAFAELIEKAEKDKAKDAEDKANLKRDAQDVRVELHNASTARAPPVKKEKKEGEDGTDTGMRGYKTTSDGRTTSYFHTEISKEAKELIEKQGFGKPQKIEAPLEVKEAKGGGSSWNQATYEERNMSKWISVELPKALTGVTFAVPQGGNVVVKNVVDIKGPATVTVARGKRKHLLDLSFDVEFELKVGDDTGAGKLCYSEVTADDGDEGEVKLEVNSDTPNALRGVVDAYVKPNGAGLQPVILEALKKLIAAFKQQ
jgi:hypothetical protein